MIITNERKYIEKILDTKKFPEPIPIMYLCTLIIKYYYSPDISLDDYFKEVTHALSTLNLDVLEYQEYKFAGFIKKTCSDYLSGKKDPSMKEIDKVYIYESEMNVIESVKRILDRKLLFTMYVLAKLNLKPSGWVNCGRKEIFNRANIKLTISRQCEKLYSLWQMGIIEQNERCDSFSFKVNLSQDTNEPVAAEITSFKDIGDQYLDLRSNRYKRCVKCGTIIKMKANSKKFCKKCADESRLASYRKYYQKKMSK